MHSSPVLKNNRVRLRAIEPEDVDLLFAVENDAEAWGYGDTTAPFSRELLQQYAFTYDADPLRSGQLRLVICSSDTDSVPMGIIDLYDISVRDRHAFLSLYILPQFRGKGVANDAVTILKNYSAQILGLQQLAIYTATSNTAARALFSKCGFIERGILSQWHFNAGKFEDIIILQAPLQQSIS